MVKKNFSPSLSLLVLILIHLLSTSPLSALHPQRGWTVGLMTNMHWGEAREILYYNGETLQNNQNDYISLLLWELCKIPSVGVNSHWESGKIFRLDMEFSTAIPGLPSGQMNDYDWFYTDKKWSHWSVSDIDLRWGFNANVSVDWKVKGNSNVSLHVGASYVLSSWAWTDSFIDLIYSKTTKNKSYPVAFGTYPQDEYRVYSNQELNLGNTVDYEVTYQSILANLVMRINSRILFLDLHLRIGPVLTLSLDKHILRDLQFHEIGFGFPWVDTRLEVGFRIQQLTLGVRGQFTWVNDIRGNVSTYDESGNVISFSSNSGGSGLYNGGFGFYVSWTFKPRSRA